MAHKSDVKEMIIYFYLCDGWKGEPKSNEAEEVFWIGADELDILDFNIDKVVIEKILREI